MAALVLVVVVIGPDGDPAAALSALAAERRVVVRGPDAPTGPLPPGVELAVDPEYERAVLAARLRRAGDELIVVLMEDERLSPELATALVAQANETRGLWAAGSLSAVGSRWAASGPTAAGSGYAVARRVRFLGREIDADPIEIAWGDRTASAAPVRLPGALLSEPTTIAAHIARLEALAARARPGVAVSPADFVGRPLAAVTRRLWRRRRDGVPGLILSMLETYGEVLTAAHAWERQGIRPRRSEHLGSVPPGFHVWRTPWGWLMLRDGTAASLRESLFEATPEHVRGEPIAGGRGGVWALSLEGDRRAMLRWYRRGGAIRHLVRDRYFGWAPRPILELGLTEEARRRGIAAPEVLATRVDRLRGGWYRGAIVTREVPNATTLAAALQRHESAAERTAILTAVGRAVRRLHDRGVHHRDLNATNVLLRPDRDGWAVHFIDFDRADVRAAVGTRARSSALRRLERSLAKLARAGMPLAPEDAARVREAYDQPDDATAALGVEPA